MVAAGCRHWLECGHETLSRRGAPDINVTTCTYYYWWYYGEYWSHRARITVANTSPIYAVSVTPELQNLPGSVRKTGRAYLRERNWSTRTYAPSYP